MAMIFGYARVNTADPQLYL